MRLQTSVHEPNEIVGEDSYLSRWFSKRLRDRDRENVNNIEGSCSKLETLSFSFDEFAISFWSLFGYFTFLFIIVRMVKDLQMCCGILLESSSGKYYRTTEH